MKGFKRLSAAMLLVAASLTSGFSFQTKATVSEPRSTPVAVGEMAPDFTLEDHKGNKIALAEAKGKSPVVLVFYRGYW